MAEAQNRPEDARAENQPGEERAPEAGELLDLWRRERAEFLNYKRRVQHEREEDSEAVRADVVQRLFPLLDELERALTQAPPDIENHVWVRGVVLIHHRLAKLLNELGIDRLGERGEAFDPNRHDALFFDEQPDASDQRISEVHRHGYALNDRVLRPAQVTVAGPSPSQQPSEESRQRSRAG